MDLTVNNSSNVDLFSYCHFILQEKTKYLFSFNFVALNFVLPQLQQVCQLSTFHLLIYFMFMSTFHLFHLLTIRSTKG